MGAKVCLRLVRLVGDTTTVPSASSQWGGIRDDLITSLGSTRIASIPFFTESKNGGGLMRRQCTNEYKIQPIIKKTRELLGLKYRQRAKGKVRVTMWIGISLDEIVRMKDNRETWITNRWPLIENKRTRVDCMKWMEKNDYPIPRKSSCIGCPYHDDKTWREMKLNRPHEWVDAVEIDDLIRGGVHGTKEKLYLHRSLQPLKEVDFRNLEDMGQQVLDFGEECEGMCGV